MSRHQQKICPHDAIGCGREECNDGKCFAIACYSRALATGEDPHRQTMELLRSMQQRCVYNGYTCSRKECSSGVCYVTGVKLSN